MTALVSAPAAVLGSTHLSLVDFLRQLRRRGRLLPALRQVVIEESLVQAARQAGLSVPDDDLQNTADAFRRRGLTTAQKTQAWLAENRLSVDDFEACLERDLLIARLRDHVTRERIAGHFEAHKAEYDRALLRQIVVAHEDLARELQTQILEGMEFATLAREHSLDASRTKGGLLGVVRRSQLPADVASAVFAAAEGDVVGPLATPAGFALFQVEAKQPAALDQETTALLKEQLFAEWLNARLAAAGGRPTFPLLEAL